MRPVALAGILASTTMLGGCAGTIGGITFSSISSFAGFASTIFTGADLGEHAASIVTGKDCRFSEGLLREDRDICEEPGSLATRDDFHGIFIERIDADGTVIYAAPKYMPASVGAGENENNTDVIWAQIKAQKAVEENERQLARANNATQSIDVAALATGSLSSESLAYLPATSAAAEIADGETASQTASAPLRPVFNAAKPAQKKAEVKETLAAVDLPLDQPAIDEGALTAPLKAARENGQGGPLFTTAASASSAPVASTLVNGEPVVVLRLSFGGVQPSLETASAVPSDAVLDDTSTVVALPAASVSAPSPLAVLNQTAPKPAEAIATAPATDPMPQSRQRKAAPAKPEPVQPAPVEIAATPDVAIAEETAPIVEKPKKKKRQAAEDVLVKKAAAADPADVVYSPPIASSTAPDLMSPVQSPGDIPTSSSMPAPGPAATAPVAAYVPPATSEPTPAATAGPAPLFPIAQP